MSKIITFGASNSTTSINKVFATYVASQFQNADVEVLDLNDYEMPIYSPQRQSNGFPEPAQRFYQKIGEADLLVISFAEHNGNFTAAYKNILDWVSRIDMKLFQNKPVIILSTSPGPKGASSVLNIASVSLPYQGAVVRGQFSLPSFYQNYDEKKGILNTDLKNELSNIIADVSSSLN